MLKLSNQNGSNLENKSFIVLKQEELNLLTGGMKGKVKWFNDVLGIWVEEEVEL